MKTRVFSQSPDDLEEAAETIIKLAGNRTVFAFYGVMGSGKTTIIKAFCRVLGSADIVTSPTFSLINQYFDNKQNPIYHFDFYRINSLNEAMDIGYEEYFFSGNYCLIEWPEKIEPLLPPDCVKVSISRGKEILQRIIDVKL